MGRRRRAGVIVAVVGGALLALVLVRAAIRPSHDRDWKPEHARIPRAAFDASRVTVENVRDFRWTGPDRAEERWDTRTYDLDSLRTVWLVLSVFDPEDPGPAHSALSFGFAGDEYLCVSVEARKEVGEGYSIWKGMARRYELIYVLGDERDLVRTRAVDRADEVFLFPIRTTPDKARALLRDILDTANRLAERPRFYDTLTENCTTVLRDHVNRVTPGRIPPSWRVLLPGYSDVLLRQLDLLDDDADLAVVRERYRINDRARAAADAPDFSVRIRDVPDSLR
jgi:hypothetical protein